MIANIIYFTIPTAIFLAFAKLNSKHRWIIANRRNALKYYTDNGVEIYKTFFWFVVFVFFFFWPVMLPGSMIALAIIRVINWITKGEGIIPMEKNDRRGGGILK